MEGKMTQNRKVAFICLIALAGVLMPVLAHAGDPAQRTQQTHAEVKHAVHETQLPDEGERVFQQNCARCHASPDGFSSRISGTVVRHMRVRAGLSAHDEKALLKFFNP